MTTGKTKRKWGLFLMGMALAACSAVMTAEAGYRLHGVVLGAIFVICTFGACVMPNQSVSAFRSGRWGSGIATAIVTVLFVTGELAGELMVMSAVRGKSDQSATMQNTKWVDLDKSITSLEKQLATATETLERQSKYESATAYEAQIKDAEALAARESSKERNGCKAKCDAALKVVADLRSKHAIATERDTKTEPLVKDLTAKIEVAKTERKTATMGYSESAGQTDLFAAISTNNLNPDGSAKKWTDIYFTLFMAAFVTFGSMGLVYASEQDWNEPKKPKSPRDSRTVRMARHIRRLWANINGDVIEHHTTTDTEASAMLEQIRRNLKAA